MNEWIFIRFLFDLLVDHRNWFSWSRHCGHSKWSTWSLKWNSMWLVFIEQLRESHSLIGIFFLEEKKYAHGTRLNNWQYCRKIQNVFLSTKLIEKTAKRKKNVKAYTPSNNLFLRLTTCLHLSLSLPPSFFPLRASAFVNRRTQAIKKKKKKKTMMMIVFIVVFFPQSTVNVTIRMNYWNMELIKCKWSIFRESLVNYSSKRISQSSKMFN